MIEHSDTLSSDEAVRAAWGDLHPTRPAPVPAHHTRRGCCASTPPLSPPTPSSTASTCCAPAIRTCRPRTSPCGYKQLLEVERGWRDMKQVLDLRPVLPPPRGPHPRPRPAVLARAAPAPDRRDPHQPPRRHLDQLAPRPRRAAAAARRRVHRARRHLPSDHRSHRRGPPAAHRARPAPAAPDPAPRHRDRPQPADQPQHHRLVTRHVTRRERVRPAQTPYPGTFNASQLRNPGARTARVSCGVACSGHEPRNLAAMMTRRSLTAMSS